eukprot:COSAG01_NODE_12895_length_1668_cov_0.801785_2_plen_83_part_01
MSARSSTNLRPDVRVAGVLEMIVEEHVGLTHETQPHQCCHAQRLRESALRASQCKRCAQLYKHNREIRHDPLPHAALAQSRPE